MGRDSITAEAPDAASTPAAPEGEAERQFREEVLPDELDYIRDRRAIHGLDPQGGVDSGAALGKSLVGLALSGGGIRSATFNLGLLQALDRHGFFKHIDYVSTVSGGGFIGSCLSALLSEAQRKTPGRVGAAQFPFRHSAGRDEEETVKYLRGHSDYLAPKGLMDYLRAFALLSRGIVLNLVLLLPILLILSLVGMVLTAGRISAASGFDTLSLPMTGAAILWVAVLFVGLYPVAIVLSGPLGRLVAALRGTVGGLVALLPTPALRRARTAEKKAAKKESRDVAVTWRIAGSLLLGLPLFGGILGQFDNWSESTQRYMWPWLGLGWLVAWFLLCVVFLLPLLRRWRPRRAALAVRQARPPSLARSIACSLGLLAPWALLALAFGGLEPFFFAGSPIWRELPRWLVNSWLIVPVWWISCIVLLAPVLFGSAPDPQEISEERAREWHRRVVGRLYSAACLPLWGFMALATFHELLREGVQGLLGAAVAGFGVEDGTLAAALTTVAFLGFVFGLHFVVWKVFARLARGPLDPGPGAGAGISRGVDLVAARSTILWRERYEKAFSLALVVLAAIAFLEIQPYLVYYYNAVVDWLRLLAAASFLVIVLAAMFIRVLQGVGQKIVLALLGILGPLLPFLVYLTFVDALYGEGWSQLREAVGPNVSPEIVVARLTFFVVIVGVAAYLLGKLIDANATGMHGFYRDRVSQSYLVGVDRDGVLGPEDELGLTEVCQEGSGAPYHLINASLNMQAESTGAQRWRNSDFFAFGPRWCGGPASEYCRTEDLEYLAPHVHLGSAMAVSAAAASPNMGSYTSRFLVFLMTLLNVRLGLWLPTPRRVRRMAQLGIIGSAEGVLGRVRRWWLRLKSRPSGYHLVDEMASRLDASGPYVNLTDGGHLENTGAYELLRRRCKLIVIGDAESDPGMRFGSLAALMRYASIDLGVEIDIDLEPLRLRSDGTSEGHWALGTIHYPPPAEEEKPETGCLLYVKASVDGSESEVIREYRARNPSFPQESTADQVFEEDQFEAYRALGFRIGSRLFGEAEPLTSAAEVEGWLAGLGGSGESATG